MAKFLKISILNLLIFSCFLGIAADVSAKTALDSFQDSLQTTGQGTGHVPPADNRPKDAWYPGEDLSGYVSAVISAILGLLGIFFLGLMIYGGYLWMTDRGDEKQAQKAKGTIQHAIIGLLIVIVAWVLTEFFINTIIAGMTTATSE